MSLRRWRKRRRIKAVVPSLAPRTVPFPLDRKACKRRTVIERTWGRLKNWRRIAARHDRLARNCLAGLALVSVVIAWAWMSSRARGCADHQVVHWFKPGSDDPLMQRFGKELFNRVRKAAKNRPEKREEKLFGRDKPERGLSDLPRSQPADDLEIV